MLHTDVAVIKTFHWLNDVPESRHNAFVMLTKWGKSAFAFHFFDSLYASDSSVDAYSRTSMTRTPLGP